MQFLSFKLFLAANIVWTGQSDKSLFLWASIINGIGHKGHLQFVDFLGHYFIPATTTTTTSHKIGDPYHCGHCNYESNFFFVMPCLHLKNMFSGHLFERKLGSTQTNRHKPMRTNFG